jgi:hypothetical protein
MIYILNESIDRLLEARDKVSILSENNIPVKKILSFPRAKITLQKMGVQNNALSF